MGAFESEIHQVFVKLLDGKHRIVNFDVPSVSISALKHRIETLTSIPSDVQLLVNNSRILDDHQTLILDQACRKDRDVFRCRSEGLQRFPVVVNLLLRLRGGKGGFGSLLRGAATKAGQKKTNNFDACRDMSGRRLRHVNAEKKLEEWRAEAAERNLEKMAEDFLKKKAKEVRKSGKGNGGDGAEKYVAKYREDSEKCREEVERSVRESVMGLMGSKRKSQAEGKESASKKLKIWLGKRKLGDSDSDTEEDEDVDGTGIEEEQNEGSVIIDNGSHSDSSKELDASSGLIGCEEPGAGSIEQGPSGNGSEEESIEESLKSVKSPHPMMESTDGTKDKSEVASPSKSHSNEVHEVAGQTTGASGSEDEVVSAAGIRDNPADESVSVGVSVQNIENPLNFDDYHKVSVGVSVQNIEKPLNFDDYHSAAELEVLGLERLKSELQALGLKCGGTLQERATRLFLLKTTPLEMLPKKLFAKK